MTNADKLDRAMRYIISFVVYILGILVLFAVLFFGFRVDPVSWPVALALLTGYFLGRITKGIEK